MPFDFLLILNGMILKSQIMHKAEEKQVETLKYFFKMQWKRNFFTLHLNLIALYCIVLYKCRYFENLFVVTVLFGLLQTGNSSSMSDGGMQKQKRCA